MIVGSKLSLSKGDEVVVVENSSSSEVTVAWEIVECLRTPEGKVVCVCRVFLFSYWGTGSEGKFTYSTVPWDV